MFPLPLQLAALCTAAYNESARSFTAVYIVAGDLFALMQRNKCHISAVCSP